MKSMTDNMNMVDRMAQINEMLNIISHLRPRLKQNEEALHEVRKHLHDMQTHAEILLEDSDEISWRQMANIFRDTLNDIHNTLHRVGK